VLAAPLPGKSEARFSHEQHQDQHHQQEAGPRPMVVRHPLKLRSSYLDVLGES
jgi:hypothetical protein